MDHPVLKPPSLLPGESEQRAQQCALAPESPASPGRRRPRPGWKPTLVRRETFALLRKLQKSTSDPAIDLSYLSDACIRIALELGPEAVVQRALADMSPVRKP